MASYIMQKKWLDFQWGVVMSFPGLLYLNHIQSKNIVFLFHGNWINFQFELFILQLHMIKKTNYKLIGWTLWFVILYIFCVSSLVMFLWILKFFHILFVIDCSIVINQIESTGKFNIFLLLFLIHVILFF